jgi:hypothetical protein
MEFQFYLPAWWHLWPHYSAHEEWLGEEEFGYNVYCVTDKFFCFGPFQFRWRSFQNCSGLGY